MNRLPLLLILLFTTSRLTFSQTGIPDPATGRDTVLTRTDFTVTSALNYIRGMVNDTLLWRTPEDSLRFYLERLAEETAEPFDSIAATLDATDFRSVEVLLRDRLLIDSIDIRWLNDSTFIVDSIGWNTDLMLSEEIRTEYPVDFSTLVFSDSILDERGMLDSTLFIKDTILVTVIDTAALEALEVPMHQFRNDSIVPPVVDPMRRRSARITPDSAFLVFTDTASVWMTAEKSAFYRLRGPHQLDSLQHAIGTLLRYNTIRDSVRIWINDTYGKEMPLWVTSGDDDFMRFWVKNYKNDSITLWIGNPDRNEISLILEDEINVNRLGKVRMNYLPVELREPERSLADMVLLEPIPVYWDYDFSSAFSFNQTYLANWTKGGESSLATMLDVSGGATYNNKEANTQWINSVRLKYGTLLTADKGLRKNNDELVMNSKFNRNASGKIGLSATFYMKNQLAKGFSYPNDSIPVSKFLNPGTLTVGLGAEYKPFKHTSLNMAPLSYKNTFVLDTAQIDQTKHGINEGKRARQEMGTQLVVNNTFSPLEDMTVASTLRLFSNYLNNPENIDVDWEVTVDQKINWFFTIRLNLHLIYDDDVRFTVFDENDEPVLLPDGSKKKVAKTQFKEFIGLSLSFKF